MSRPQKTLTDYVAIAISPALIMILIGSLIFFLIEAFYQGGYEGRVRWAFGCFVFAAVLIGRISIDEGREYALLYTIPLGLAMLMVLARFVEFQGPMAGLSLPINAGLILIVLWCADRLTWDCTVIDDRKDASGQGLLQTAGLDRRDNVDRATEAAKNEVLEATSSRDEAPALTWWERFCQYRKRPHAPGVWVIYVSLAALPLFGIGQRFIPADNLPSRRYAFWMLCYFVASALGLLLNSSFLALRRYLRQRRLEMPMEMAGTWLGTGLVMILVLLTLCTALPRPHPEYSITQLVWSVGAPAGLRPSRHGLGREGAEDQQRKIPAATTGDPDPSQPVQGKPADAPRAESDQGQPTSSGKKSNGGSSGDAKSKSAKPDSGQPKSATADSSDAEPSDSRDFESQAPDASEDESVAADSAQHREQLGKTAPRFQNLPTNLGAMLNTALSSLAHAIKWLYYLLFVAVVVYLVWRYWEQVRSAIQGFWSGIRDWLARLRGGQRRPSVAGPADASAPPAPSPRPFAAFADPFTSGEAQRLDPRELVAYTFRALEAWGREHGCPRLDQQTPHEFAGKLAGAAEDVGREATRLADLYCAAAYSNRPLGSASVGSLENLWKTFRKHP